MDKPLSKCAISSEKLLACGAEDLDDTFVHKNPIVEAKFQKGAIVVQKFGGASLADVELIKEATSFVALELAKNNKVIVVVSAMHGFTDKLLSYIKKISALEHIFDLREHDAILSAGEQISAGLFALALNNQGIKAKSLMGWQVPIITDALYSEAFIENINTELILNLLDNNCVPVITGFQGLDKDNNITTLERGGSDTSAVAIAVALNAERCDIYTNVEGVYTADPDLVNDSFKISSLSYKEMLDISLYAKVLNSRSVEIARNNSLPMRVLSSFKKDVGNFTSIGKGSVSFNVLNITHTDKCSMLRVGSLNILALNQFKDPIILLLSSDDGMIIVCDHKHYVTLCDFAKNIIEETELYNGVGLINLVGSRISINNAQIFSEVSETLKNNNIKVLYSIVSEIKISIIINHEHVNNAVSLLHKFHIKCNETV